jgi:hypothetical protein
MNPSQPPLVAVITLAIVGSGAILLAPSRGACARPNAVFAGLRSHTGWDYALLAGTILGLALHAAIARPLLGVLAKMSWDRESDVLAFWMFVGPSIAAWCALCVAVRWALRRGLTRDGNIVWFTLMGVAVSGWPSSLLGVLFGNLRLWIH